MNRKRNQEGSSCVAEFNPYPANVDNMVSSTNASKWRMGFNSAFKGLKYFNKQKGNHQSQLNVDKDIVVEIRYIYRPYMATIRYFYFVKMSRKLCRRQYNSNRHFCFLIFLEGIKNILRKFGHTAETWQRSECTAYRKLAESFISSVDFLCNNYCWHKAH